MKRVALAWLSISAVAVACSSGGGGPNAGSAGAGQTGGAGGAAGRGGSGAKGGTGGSTTGSAGTTGVGGAAGTTGSAGTIGVGGAGGTAGSAGTTGLGGAGGSGGRGGIGGSSGGGASGSTGTGGRGGTGGSSGGGGGAGAGGTGTGGGAGASGGGGSGGGSGPVHVTSAQALPNFQGSSRLVAVDSQDTAVVVGPSAASDTEDPGPRITWIPRQGSPHGMTYANAVTPSAIAIDPSRNVWLLGQLFRAVSFGGPTLQPVDSGYYLVRLDSDGNPALGRAITRAGSALVYGAAADGQGNVYAVGNVYSAGSPLTSSVFVTKFSSAGDEIYTQEFASQGTTAYGVDIAVASNGDVFIVGAYNSPLQIGTVLLTLPASSIGSGFVAALDAATGAPNWATRVGGSDFDIINSIEVTGSGALRIAGMVTGSATVGGVTVQADTNGSPFIAELTSSGSGNWVKLIQGAGIVFAADTSATGHTFAVGYVNGTTKDTFVADVTADGTATLPLRVTIPDDTNGANVAAADRHGGVWVTGDFKGSVDFGLGALSAGGATTFGDFLVHLEP